MPHPSFRTANRRIPIVSLILAFTCIAATVAVTCFPELDPVLNGMYPIVYPWQRFTAIFIHGATIDTTLHLAGNLTGIFLFGVLCELALPPVKFMIFFTGALLINIAVLYLLRVEGNGVSTLVWAFTPVAALILYRRWGKFVGSLLRRNGSLSSLSKRKLLCLGADAAAGLLLLFTWFIHPLIFGHNYMHDTGLLAGLFFALLLKNDVKQADSKADFSRPETRQPRTGFHPVSLAALLIPAFLGTVTLLTYTRTIPSIHLLRLTPSSGSPSAAINQSEGRILAEFDHDMDISNTGSITVTSDRHTDVTAQWQSSSVIAIRFNRKFDSGEKVRIRAEFFSSDGRRVLLKSVYTEGY